MAMSASEDRTSRATAEVMFQVLRYASSFAFTEGLNPAQWAALRYLSQAPAPSRTLLAFTRYHGTTKGTASQTISSLVRKGLVDRIRNEQDRRSARLDLTAEGRTLVGNDPLLELADTISALRTAERLVLMECLEHILRRLMAKRQAALGETEGLGGEGEHGDDGDE